MSLAAAPEDHAQATRPEPIRDASGKQLVADCLAGDNPARAEFQQRFGALIYRFAACVGRSAQTEPGDFYVYLFDGDRLYRRLRSYEGRASLDGFLRGYVLPDLFEQFQTMIKKETLDTVSLGTCVREPADTATGRVDLSAGSGDPPGGMRGCTDLFERLSPEKRLLVKLLYIEDFTLSAEDVQLLAQRSGRSVREVVELVEQARESVRAREASRQGKLEEAESAARWILQYERRLGQIAEDLRNLPPRATRAERLREEQADLERKRQWRQQQQGRAMVESQRATVTLRYREIAHILNVPIGNVSAQVTRLRQELLNLAVRHASKCSSSPSPSGREPALSTSKGLG